MKKFLPTIIMILIVIGVLGLSNSLYIINEDEVAVIKQLNKKVAAVVDSHDKEQVQENLNKKNYGDINIITARGLHFKIPFIQTVTVYNAKYLTYTSNIERINTRNGRRVEIQMYAQYRVLDPVTFDDTITTKAKANKIMDDYIYKTVITSANKLTFDEFFYLSTLEDLLVGKQEALNEELVKDFGLYVSDVGVNYKGFPESNISNIEEKMAKEIQKESEKLKAEGDAEYKKAQAVTDRQRSEIMAKAIEEAAITKAGADAEAIKIYQESLNKDLEFYKFIQKMNIYKNIKNSTIFLDENNGIFDEF